MSETVNQETKETGAEKKFSQDEVNKLIEERLKREKAKYSDYDTLKTQIEDFKKSESDKDVRIGSLTKELEDFKKADEVRKIRESVANETGVPVGLLTETDEEALKAQAAELLKFASSKQVAPILQDKGEVKQIVKSTPQADFNQWWGEITK